MKKILVIAVSVIGLALALTGAGMLLPQDHVAARTVTIAAPPERVFALISNVDTYMTWRSSLDGIERVPDDGKGVRFVEKAGGDRILFRIEALEPNARMVTRIADPNLPFGGSWTFELKPNGTGTDLTITEAGEVYNPFFRTMQKLFFSPYRSIDAYQADLKKFAEGS